MHNVSLAAKTVKTLLIVFADLSGHAKPCLDGSPPSPRHKLPVKAQRHGDIEPRAGNGAALHVPRVKH